MNHPATFPPQEAESSFLRRLADSLDDLSFVRLILSRYQGGEPDLQRMVIRPIRLRGEDHLSLVYRYRTRDVTKNLPLQSGLAHIATLLGTDFRSAHLFHTAGEIQLSYSRKGKASMRQAASATPAPTPSPSHDRQKERLLDSATPFLKALGVTDANGLVLPSMARKWKQMNAFLEIVQRAAATAGFSPDQPVAVLDYGSGKGYLTFAVHQLLRERLGLDARVTGIELRGDLVRFCNDVAQSLRLETLRFIEGSLQTELPEPPDLLIALHACDTATDQAICIGIRSRARIIICSPCCHKELRPQLKPPAVLHPMLRFGVHRGQEADMLTDSIRVLLLEREGYETQCFEFISPEHTARSHMILAVRKSQPVPAEAIARQLAELKAFYGIESQSLELLLQGGFSPKKHKYDSSPD